VRVRLPTGGTLVAWSDPAQGVPNDCALVFSVLPQVASYLASTQCLLKLLGLVPPLVDVVKALPPSPALVPVVPKFLKAAEALVPCEQGAASPVSALPFIQDLLCLTMTALNCIIGQLKTLVAILAGLAAQSTGNAELAHALQAAQKQAQEKAKQIFGSIDSIRALLDLAAPVFSVAGMQPVQLPAAPSQADLNSLTQLLASLQSSAATLQVAADALGGC
jgi:hypothetical protein